MFQAAAKIIKRELTTAVETMSTMLKSVGPTITKRLRSAITNTIPDPARKGKMKGRDIEVLELRRAILEHLKKLDEEFKYVEENPPVQEQVGQPLTESPLTSDDDMDDIFHDLDDLDAYDDGYLADMK